jgi:hypothetical protein
MKYRFEDVMNVLIVAGCVFYFVGKSAGKDVAEREAAEAIDPIVVAEERLEFVSSCMQELDAYDTRARTYCDAVYQGGPP